MWSPTAKANNSSYKVCFQVQDLIFPATRYVFLDMHHVHFVHTTGPVEIVNITGLIPISVQMDADARGKGYAGTYAGILKRGFMYAK